MMIPMPGLAEQEFEKYREAGRIAKSVKEEAQKLVSSGRSVLETAIKIEEIIRSLGGEPAFPVNISIGSVAAHYTPTYSDKSLFPEKGLVKIDFGVHIDGYIVDTAFTIDLGGDYRVIMDAAKEALEKALSRISPGVSFRDVGRIVEETAKRYSLKPVRNLSGHRIDRYKIHAGESIPNYSEALIPWRFREGGVYAIEPFITSGAGLVSEGRLVTIYSVKKTKVKSSEEEARVLREAIARFKGLPFCSRWLADLGGDIDAMLENLRSKGALHPYPVLVEVSGAQVAQFEETVAIYEGSVYILTR
ncbi:type II methionyl aminopeptidase [Desulfurococcaceae archaeon AG1]|jgi:methionyl aminopeptidase|nr:type II methionyl aminopeptidase [Desulfurococcaceae archaeon AG1]